jgi:hypothetical protein
MELTTIVKTEIHETKRGSYQKAHKGHNRPEVEAEDMIYVIKYQIGGYFTYSYLSRERAEESMKNSVRYKCNTKQYYDFNVVSEPAKTITVK